MYFFQPNNYKKKNWKTLKYMKLNNTLKNNQWVKKTKREIKKYVETNTIETLHAKTYWVQ